MAEKYIDWNPVSVSYLNNKMDMTAKMYSTPEGFIFSYNPLQSTVKSIGDNTNSVALLTDASGLADIQADYAPSYSDTNLIRNSLITSNGWYLTKAKNDTINISVSNETVGNVFKLEFDENDQILSIVAEDIDDRKYLTLAVDGLSSYFDVYNTNTDHLQKFKYLLNLDNNNLVLFCDVLNDGQYKALTYDEDSRSTSISAVSAFTPSIATYCVFSLANTDKSIRGNIVDKSKYVRYDMQLDNNQTLYDDLGIATAIPFNNNFLFTIEPKSNNDDLIEDVTYVPSNAIALKNAFNPQYKAECISTVLSSQNRDYNNVFLGNNIDNDYYNKPLLSYQSDKKQITLKADNVTYFHYPYDISSLDISLASFIKSGAIAGTSPSKSDRIWKAQSGYGTRTNKGSSQGLQNGLWLCSWLKKGDTGNYWVDRWYDHNEISYKLALTADEPNLYIKDEVSTMTLDPGVLYKFFHIGSTYSIKLIEDAEFNQYPKILEIKDWDSEGVHIVNGGSRNISYTKFNESELTLTGTEYVSFSANPAFYPENQLSMAAWVYFDNWHNVSADQIIGNYYNGGYGIGFDTGINTNTVIFADKKYGHLFIANTENKYLNDKPLPGVSATVTDISYDLNGNVWVLDGYNSKVHVYNPINNIFTKTITLPTSSNYVFSNNGGDGHYYAFDNLQNRFTKVTTNGMITNIELSALSSTFLPLSTLTSFPVNGFFIDSGNRIQPYTGNTAFEDNAGDIWHHFGSNFVKNNEEYVLHLCSPDDIKVDGDFNIWYIKDKTLYHVDREGNMLFSKEYPYLSSGVKKLTLTREVTVDGWADFIWVLDSNSLIKFTSDGKFVKISKPREFLNISQYAARDRNNLDIFLPSKATQYDYYRDRKVLPPGLNDINYIVARFSLDDGYSTEQYKLKYSTSFMDKGWHHLAFTFDSSLGTATLYVDGEDRNTISFTKGTGRLSYNSKNKFYIGNTNGFNDNKSQDYLLNNATTMVGKVDDVRVYNKTLTSNDLLVLSRKKLEFADIPLNINVPTRQYVEEIDKFNAHRIPGFKSNVFNIRILNSDINNEELKDSIESAICATIKKITPVGSKLNKIVWE